MKPQPKLAVTGYRGIWGESLNEQIAFEYAHAYAKMISSISTDHPKKVLIGRDARPSGKQIFQSVKEALERENIEIINAGIIPTPSVLLLVKKLNLSGGVMITASHNPIEYNGIKFVVPGGRLTNESEVKAIESFRANFNQSEKTPERTNQTLDLVDNSEFRKIHIDTILEHVDVNLIRSKKFKVTLDPVNGAGAFIGEELLKALGCEVKVINQTQDGTFAHPPEPLVQNLGQVAEETVKNNSNIGFALDPDADRLVAINERGEVISEEHTLVLIIKNILAKEAGDIVVNISSSKMSEDVAKEFGRKTHYSKVGEANVVAKMLEINAPVGGEGGGGAIYPKINTARDGLVCIALILEMLAREDKKISAIVESLPKYFIKKDKIPVTGDVSLLYEKIKAEFKEGSLNDMDGVRFDWPDGAWLILRASITEPICRIIGEAKTPERIEELFQRVKLTLNDK